MSNPGSQQLRVVGPLTQPIAGAAWRLKMRDIPAAGPGAASRGFNKSVVGVTRLSMGASSPTTIPAAGVAERLRRAAPRERRDFMVTHGWIDIPKYRCGKSND